MTSGIEQWLIVLVRNLFISAVGIVRWGLENYSRGWKCRCWLPVGTWQRRWRRSVCPRNPKLCGNWNNTPNARRKNYWGPSCNRNECWLHPFRYLIVSSRTLCILSPDFSVVFYLQKKGQNASQSPEGLLLWPQDLFGPGKGSTQTASDWKRKTSKWNKVSLLCPGRSNYFHLEESYTSW